ncbi:uncharacterized protein LY89DRAFT_722103 [Mollisia scopiformis]|uniref:Uncharacterized protein n=1 Tax=Mollisia scopiformis TaxID=149040 RepID=A0A194WWZ6_MOLSC|nr:uncharacterized protein LY89DRAFT_722103 [Mollisia scopiformis]KUJ12503.1 hypothetical protein LY89DRAFT_722103 [Mollisia scopiformis]
MLKKIFDLDSFSVQLQRSAIQDHRSRLFLPSVGIQKLKFQRYRLRKATFSKTSTRDDIVNKASKPPEQSSMYGFRFTVSAGVISIALTTTAAFWVEMRISEMEDWTDAFGLPSYDDWIERLGFCGGDGEEEKA